jgi:hypothetical protein
MHTYIIMIDVTEDAINILRTYTAMKGLYIIATRPRPGYAGA